MPLHFAFGCAGRDYRVRAEIGSQGKRLTPMVGALTIVPQLRIPQPRSSSAPFDLTQRAQRAHSCLSWPSLSSPGVSTIGEAAGNAPATSPSEQPAAMPRRRPLIYGIILPT